MLKNQWQRQVKIGGCAEDERSEAQGKRGIPSLREARQYARLLRLIARCRDGAFLSGSVTC